MGGLALFLAVVVGMAVAHQLHFADFQRLFRTSLEPTGVLVACAVVVAIGVYDDVRGTAAPVKLAGQIMAAGLLVLFGVQLLYFFFPGQGLLILGSDLAVPLTVIWVVAMVNAVNLIDGLDGLAAGMVAIAALAFFIYVFQAPSPVGIPSGNAGAALLSALAAGAALGFLPWNFHPARIFMGDSGSMLLGILLAAATIMGVGRNFGPPSGGDLAAFSIPVLVPLVILAVPFLDVVLAIFRRVRRGRPVTHADKEHIHHRLLDFGHSHRQAVLLMYLWSALISASALAVALLNGRLLVGGIGLAERSRRPADERRTGPVDGRSGCGGGGARTGGPGGRDRAGDALSRIQPVPVSVSGAFRGRVARTGRGLASSSARRRSSSSTRRRRSFISRAGV
jgi:UDP-GlcNAc:undecaprenyl-phosphate GlcNAc-1-phosphate transferase